MSRQSSRLLRRSVMNSHGLDWLGYLPRPTRSPEFPSRRFACESPKPESEASSVSLVELEPYSHCSASVNQMNAQSPPRAVRHHLPNERMSITHKFTIGAHEGYITVGLYPDSQPGEIFVIMAKE